MDTGGTVPGDSDTAAIGVGAIPTMVPIGERGVILIMALIGAGVILITAFIGAGAFLIMVPTGVGDTHITDTAMDTEGIMEVTFTEVQPWPLESDQAQV